MWSAHEHYYAKAIFIDKDSWYLKVHPDEWKRTADFLSEKGSYIIKVGEEYYEVGFATA